MSDIIDRKVKIDDRDNNIQVVIQEDPPEHLAQIKGFVSAACIIEGDFHASVKLGPQ